MAAALPWINQAIVLNVLPVAMATNAADIC
jgi:hypothetical protein